MSFDITDEVIDLRDVIERFEELESELEACEEEKDDSSVEEFEVLKSLLEELKGYGGDEQWRGDWYPNILIADRYWVEYCQDLVQDIGDLPRDIPSYLEIDWNKTADNLQQDYSSVIIGDEEYYYR